MRSGPLLVRARGGIIWCCPCWYCRTETVDDGSSSLLRAASNDTQPMSTSIAMMCSMLKYMDAAAVEACADDTKGQTHWRAKFQRAVTMLRAALRQGMGAKLDVAGSAAESAREVLRFEGSDAEGDGDGRAADKNKLAKRWVAPRSVGAMPANLAGEAGHARVRTGMCDYVRVRIGASKRARARAGTRWSAWPHTGTLRSISIARAQLTLAAGTADKKKGLKVKRRSVAGQNQGLHNI